MTRTFDCRLVLIYNETGSRRIFGFVLKSEQFGGLLVIALLEKLNGRKTALMLLLLFAPLLLMFLGAPSLWDQDESVYGEISRQMAVRHDYLGAYYNDQFRPEKPPLNYWINVFWYRIFGINEFATRLGSCLFGLFGVILVYLIAKRLFNKRTGILAGLMLGTAFLYFIETQLAIIDTTLSFFIALTLYWFYIGYFEEKPRFLLWMGVPVGLGVLAKGPVGLLLPGMVGLVCWLVFTFKFGYPPRRLFNRWLLGGLFVAAVISLPWYVLMWLQFGMRFINEHFGYHMFRRFTTPIENHGGNLLYLFYYLFWLIIGFIPWTGQLWGSFQRAWRRWREPRFFFIGSWFVLLFGFFSISQTKLPGYIVPIFPPVAVLLANWWDELFDHKHSSNLWIGMIVQFGFSLLFALLLLAVGSQLPSGYGYAVGIFFLLPLSFIVSALIIRYRMRRQADHQIFFNVTFITFYLVWAIFLGSLIPVMEVYKPTKYLAQRVKKIATPQDIVVSNIKNTFSAPFYTGRHVERINSPQAFLRMWHNNPRRVLALVEKKTLQALKNANQPYYVLAQHGSGYLISNRPVEKSNH